VSSKTIPDKLPGTVGKQWVKCGKPNCRCTRGELHGPYWYRFWRDKSGRTHKQYVKEADLETVRTACASAHEDILKVSTILERGRWAVSWFLEGSFKLPSSADGMLRAFNAPVDIKNLADCAADKNVPSHFKVRAFELLSPWLSPGCFRRSPLWP
jgi:hypothetical protein